MSDTGLHAGLYDYARNLAELVDAVLVELRTKPSDPISANRKDLGEMLLATTSRRWSDMTSRLLALTLDDIPGFKLEDWQEVGRDLLSNASDHALVTRLERLARALEEEQLDAASRIRD